MKALVVVVKASTSPGTSNGQMLPIQGYKGMRYVPLPSASCGSVGQISISSRYSLMIASQTSGTNLLMVGLATLKTYWNEWGTVTTAQVSQCDS